MDPVVLNPALQRSEEHPEGNLALAAEARSPSQSPKVCLACLLSSVGKDQISTAMILFSARMLSEHIKKGQAAMIPGQDW